jgi:glutamine amidotransferase
MRIVTLSSGVGNVRSVVRALERATNGRPSAEIVTTADPDAIRRGDVLVVPGQGAFGAFAAALDGGLRDVLVERVRAGTPYFGICLGLQILFEESDEAPGARGLGILRGRVRRLRPGADPQTGRERPLPHIGWNRAEVRGASEPWLRSAYYYFAHTYVAAPEAPEVTAATTRYGDDTFTSAVRKENVAGVQFHPEKSQSAGISLLEQFFRTFVTGT